MTPAHRQYRPWSHAAHSCALAIWTRNVQPTVGQCRSTAHLQCTSRFTPYLLNTYTCTQKNHGGARHMHMCIHHSLYTKHMNTKHTMATRNFHGWPVSTVLTWYSFLISDTVKCTCVSTHKKYSTHMFFYCMLCTSKDNSKRTVARFTGTKLGKTAPEHSERMLANPFTFLGHYY